MKRLMLCVVCFVFLLSTAGCGSQSKTSEEMITLTLTPQYASDITDEKLDENIVIELLDELANQIKKDEPSLFSVTNILARNNIKLKNTHIFKLKINTIFASLEEYMKMKMKFSYEDKIKKVIPDNKFNTYLLEETSFDYESDNEKILELYNW